MTHFNRSHHSVITNINERLFIKKFRITEDIVERINFHAVKDRVRFITPSQIDWHTDPRFMEDANNA